jgi:hypothetical protein
MEALLIDCAKEEQRSSITFLWSEVVKTSAAYGKITFQHGNNCNR